MHEPAERSELIAQMPWNARALLWFCKKDVRPAIYADEAGQDAMSHGPNASADPLAQLRRAFPGFVSAIAGKNVLDFGCAEGEQSRAMIAAGARSVHGLDINSPAVRVAIARSAGIAGISFSDQMPANASYDVILSQNSFEHFVHAEAILKQMYEALAPDGRVYVTFGPMWFSPWGAHVEFFCRLPWVHLFFSEKTIVRVRSLYRSDGASNYEQMGLAQMSLRKFNRLVSDSHLSIEYARLDCVKGLNFFRHTPLRELFTSQLSCILRRAS